MKTANIPPESVTDILITHIRPDHVGGLPNFPNAKIHIVQDEYKDSWKMSKNIIENFTEYSGKAFPHYSIEHYPESERKVFLPK